MRCSTVLFWTAALTVLGPTAGCDSESTTGPTTEPPAFDVAFAPIFLPYYARVERPFLIHTEDWAAVIFYRPTQCVPAGFNLLDFFDIPAAFSCGPQTVEGFEMRKDPLPPAPWQQVIRGRGAVPVWLVGWSELQAALQDDVLTRAELEALSSLVQGSATQYHEMLQPFPTRIPSRLVISASGVLADGRQFHLHYTEEGVTVRQIRIDAW